MASDKILIVMAAGSGVRMGASVPKQFLDLGGKPILRHTIERFLSAAPGIRIVTVLPKEYVPYWKDYCLSNSFDCPQTLVQGGITRFHSVRNALGRVPGGCIVAIHDGVRPLLSADLVKSMFERMESGSCRALVPVVPTVDTLKVWTWRRTLRATGSTWSPIPARQWTAAGSTAPRLPRCSFPTT